MVHAAACKINSLQTIRLEDVRTFEQNVKEVAFFKCMYVALAGREGVPGFAMFSVKRPSREIFGSNYYRNRSRS